MRLLFLFLLLPFSSKTQVNANSWGIEDTSLYIIKNTSFGVVHGYRELFNYSGGDLDMRWIRYTPSSWPVQWGSDFTDPSNTYPDVLIIDSGDFVLPDPPGFSNKLIIGVDHNGFADTSVIRFKVFPISDPTDTLWVNFHILIGNPGVSEVSSVDLNPKIIYQPESKQLYFEGLHDEQYVLTIFDLSGKIILETTIMSGIDKIDLPNLLPGVFLINLKSSDGNFFSDKIIVR